MTPKQLKFVEEYLADANATQAAIRAGYSARTAEQQGSRLLSNVEVAAAIAEAQRQRSERTAITADRVLTEAWAMLTADPREVVELHVDSCRHCHSPNHRYQRTVVEMEQDRRAHEARQAQAKKDAAPVAFDEQGGAGFDPRRPPVATCPGCHGRGVPKMVLHDSRKLSADAASLLAGIRTTRDGIEVKLHSRADAVDRLARLLGLADRVRPGSDALARLIAASEPNDRTRILIEAAAAGDLSITQATQLAAAIASLTRPAEIEALARQIKDLERHAAG